MACHRWWWMCVLGVALGACDTSDDPAADAAGDGGLGDAGTGADASDGAAGDDACVTTRLLVTTSDFVSGGLGVLELASGEALVAGTPLEDQDTAPVLAGCTPLLLMRGAGKMAVQSTRDPRETVAERSLPASGAGPYAVNPQAAVLVSGKLYVVGAAVNEVLVYDAEPALGAAPRARIDLSSFVDPDDPDGLVDATDAVVVGGEVVVALGRYWFDAGYAQHFEGSLLAVIDVATDTLVDVDAGLAGVQGIALEHENPWRGLVWDAPTDRLWVGAAGGSFALDGAVEAVDVAARVSEGALVTESELGGELEGFTGRGREGAFVLAGGELRPWEPDTGTVAAALGSSMLGARLVGDAVYAWDAAGLRRFDSVTYAETTPAGGPWTFGGLPIYGVAGCP